MGAVAMVKPHFQQLFPFTSVFITLALVKLLTDEKKKTGFLRGNVAQEQFISYVIWKLFCETS